MPLAAQPPRFLGGALVVCEVALSMLLSVAWLSSRAVAPDRRAPLVIVLIGVCAAISVMLTTLGVYVVTAYDLLRRSREIGVREVTGFKSRGTFGDICVAEWDSVGYVPLAKPVPGGGAPPTPPPGID